MTVVTGFPTEPSDFVDNLLDMEALCGPGKVSKRDLNGRVQPFLSYNLSPLSLLPLATMNTPPPNGVRSMSRLLAALDGGGGIEPLDVNGSKRGMDNIPGGSALSPARKRRATGFGIRAGSQTPAVGGFASCKLATYSDFCSPSN